MDRDRTTRRRRPVAELLLMLGGILMALSALFSYLTLHLDLSDEGAGLQTASLKGFDTDDGKFFIAFGVVVFLIGTVLWVVRKRGWRVLLAAIALVVSGFMTWVAISDLVNLRDDALNGLAESSGGNKAEALARLEQIAEVDSGLGLYLATAGAGFSLLGALLALRPQRADPDPMATPLPVGWQPPSEGSASERLAEPRSEEPAEWSPPDIEHPVSQGAPTQEDSLDPWRRQEPPGADSSGR